MDEDKAEEIDLLKFDVKDSLLSEEELGKIIKFGRRLSCTLVKEAENVAAESVDANSHDIEYSSLSEYSAYLISRIMNDGLNGFTKEVSGLPNGDSNGLGNGEPDSACEMDDESTETFSSASSEDTISVRSRNSWDSPKLSNSSRTSVVSTLSHSSSQSDGSGDNVIESPNTPSLQTPTLTVNDFHYDAPAETTGGEDTPDVQQPSEQRPKRDYKNNNCILESIKETSESSESGEAESIPDVNSTEDDFSKKTTTSTSISVNGYGPEHRNSSGNNNNSKTDNFRSRANATSSATSFSERKDSTTSEHTVSSRKESNASTQSIESNSDESEERDVLGEGFKGKRDASDKSRFGSSVRQHMLMKKVNPRYLLLLLYLSHVFRNPPKSVV